MFGKKNISKNFNKEVEPHEIFLDRIAQEKEGEFKKRFEVPIVPEKFFALKVIFLFILIFLIGKSLHLQVVKGEELSLLAQDNIERNYLVGAKRGVIYDKNMEQVVHNKSSYDLVADKRDFPKEDDEKKKIIEEVSSLINEDYNSLAEKIVNSDFPVVPILENISHEKLVILKGKVKELSGFSISENTIREYTERSLSHLLGYVGKVTKEEFKSKSNYSITDYIGRSGLEKYYEDSLRGKPGKILVEKDALGEVLSEEVISNPENGKSLVLNLDLELQRKVKSEMEKSISNVGANAGVAIALDPKTGGVLSLVSLPDADNNIFSQRISSEAWEEIMKNSHNPFFNRAISGRGYPTGSVIKPLIGIAALEEGIINKNTTIYCPLEICVKNRYSGQDECYKDWEFHGYSDLKRAIAESVNTFFYIIGGGYKDFEGLGVMKIIEYLELFNWGDKTGIDLPDEGRGILPEIDSSWRLGNTYHLSIGQGAFTATPIEVATAFGAIANGGKLISPRVVDKVVDASDQSKIIKDIEPEIIRDSFIESDNIEIIRQGMRQTVTSGSAISLNNLPVASAAKTGTAESSKKDHYHHWVAVFAPYEDPEIVLIIMVEEIKGITSATLPVAREVLDWYFSEK